ncbi:MAG: ribonuclease E/G [Eubacterium sp.]
MNRKLIVEKLNNLTSTQDNRLVVFKFCDSRLESIDCIGNDSLLGNIFVGKVKDIVDNINAAFIEFGANKIGYYSLVDNKNHIFLDSKNNNKLVKGDRILVQVSNDAIKTKACTLTSKISITGKTCVFINASQGIGFSKKIEDEEFKTKIHNIIMPPLGSYIIRTDAVNYPVDEIANEAEVLFETFNQIVEKAMHRPFGTLVYGESNPVIKYFSILKKDEYDEIIVEDMDVFETINRVMTNTEAKLTLYKDDLLPLKKLYSLEKHINNALSKKVWLKSGAYLIIEPTEAMTVIDVNTGKCISKSNSEENYLQINLEAAYEISRQLAIRNISGIIIVDFINMKADESKEKLMSYLKDIFSMSRVRTTVYDMTKLGLVEITRQKIKRSIYEEVD